MPLTPAQFTRDGSYDLWNAPARVWDADVTLTLISEGTPDAAQVNRTAAFLGWLEQRREAVLHSVAQSVLRDPEGMIGDALGGQEPTPAGVAELLDLEAITVTVGVQFKLVFGDGGLFAGHMVTAYFNEDGTLECTGLDG
ncbi:hypothetical protein [Deinococcus sp. PEB2-63]